MTAKVYKAFTTDKEMEKSGIFLVYDGGIRFLIARAGGANTKFKSVFTHLSKPHRYSIDHGTLSDDVANEMLARVYAQAIILRVDCQDETAADPQKWVENRIFLEDGKLVPATEDRIVKFLTDLPELFKGMQADAGNVANFSQLEEEEDLGNSETS